MNAPAESGAARIHVLHNDHRRFIKFGDALECRIGVLQIVETQFLALHLAGGSDARAFVGRIEVECATLMRVLAVAEHLGQ